MASTTPNPTTELTEGPISQETVELLLKSYLKDYTKEEHWIITTSVFGSVLIVLVIGLIAITIYTFVNIDKLDKRIRSKSKPVEEDRAPWSSKSYQTDVEGERNDYNLDAHSNRRPQGLPRLDSFPPNRPDQGRKESFYGRNHGGQEPMHSPSYNNYSRNPVGAHQNPSFLNELKRNSSMIQQQGRQPERIKPAPLYMGDNRNANRNNHNNNNMDMFSY